MADNHTDRISELPEAMKLEILFRLPGKDGVRMTTLSKTWKSLPILYFSFDIAKHLSSIDEALSRLHEDQKRIIGCFRLIGRFHGFDHIHVDRWLKLVTKHSIKELVLDLWLKKYIFPPTNFDGGSLVALNLKNCILAETLIQNGTGFSCLRELTFRSVDLNGLVEELLSRCPSLETLKFTCCPNLKHLKLCELPKLKKVHIYLTEVLYSCKIEVANLQTLHYIDFWDITCHWPLEQQSTAVI